MVRKKKYKIPCLQAFWGEVCLIGVMVEEIRKHLQFCKGGNYAIKRTNKALYRLL